MYLKTGFSNIANRISSSPFTYNAGSLRHDQPKSERTNFYFCHLILETWEPMARGEVRTTRFQARLSVLIKAHQALSGLPPL